MRITSGEYKGRLINMPKGIRPTQDKVRKAIFDILGDIKGLSFLELFAGSGAVGFEAASRGSAALALVEDNRSCLMVMRNNIAALKLKNYKLYPYKVEQAVNILYKEKKHFDIIFLDPPYYGNLAKKTLQTLSAYDILAPDGFLIVQHFKKDDLPAALGDLTLLKEARYGDTVLSFYRKN